MPLRKSVWEIITGLAGAVAQGYGPEHGQCLPDGLQRAESRGDVDHSGFLEGHPRDVAGLGCCSKLRQELLVKRGKKQQLLCYQRTDVSSHSISAEPAHKSS